MPSYTCYRCRRRLLNLNGPDAARWNVVVRDGYVMGCLCPSCQTSSENSEAERNLDRYDYENGSLLADGRITAPLKKGAA